MIKINIFYGESSSPSGASDAAQRQFDEWQREHDDIEVLQVATAACGTFGGASRFRFWLTIHWRWNEDPQRWGELSALVREQVEHSRALLTPEHDYEGSKSRR